MQNDATTAIDLFGPFNWSQNGGDLRYEPEKVRKNGTQKKVRTSGKPAITGLVQKSTQYIHRYETDTGTQKSASSYQPGNRTLPDSAVRWHHWTHFPDAFAGYLGGVCGLF